MSKEWDKAVAMHKKLQPRIKKVQKVQVEKMKKQVKAALAQAWKTEEAFEDALEEAQGNGISGKKLPAYMKDKGFKDALTVWKKSFEKHQTESQAMVAHCDSARKLYKELFAVQNSVKKELKVAASGADKKFADTLKSDVSSVKNNADVMGKMTAPELFYSINFTRSVDRFLKGANGSSKPVPGDASKLLDPKERKKTVDYAAGLASEMSELCEAALEKAPEGAKAAVPDLKKSAALLKELEALNKQVQAAKKTSSAEIDKAKDKGKIKQMFNAMIKLCKSAADKQAKTIAAVKKAAR